jgi:hypothetical protein
MVYESQHDLGHSTVVKKSNLVSEIKCSIRNPSWTRVLSNPIRLKTSNVASEMQQGSTIPHGVVNFK